MIELVDTCPDVNVQPAEYKRLLGYPRDWVVRDRARELVDWAREWYTKHGHPWICAHEANTLEICDGTVTIDGVPFTSPRLLKTLGDAGAHGVVLVAAGAGPELEQEAFRLWQDGRPDEYFFLEVYGSAIVEHLVTTTGARLCAWAEARQMAVLPHYSPGYPEWPIDDQPKLLALMNRTLRATSALPLEVLESGMLRPKKSLLAVFGVTHHTDRVARLSSLVPCQNCSFHPCQYRRAPYRRAPEATNPELLPFAEQPQAEPDPVAVPLDQHAKYSISTKALQRWSEERLTLERRADGTIRAIFRYDGTTCTNMERPLAFRYHVTLGSRDDGYPIRDQQCGPVEGDTGHTYMCRYMTNREHLMVAIDREKPLHGQPLNDVLVWARPSCATGCYCEPDGRQHKWGLVLETIHYALAKEAGPRA
jgi:hypothetical protein